MNRLSQALLELRDAGVLEIHSPDYTDSLRFPSAVLERSFRNYLSSVEYRPDPKGDLRARRAISEYYASAFDFACDPDDILLTCGSSESYAWVIRGFGHEVSLPAPSYPLLDSIIEYCGSMQRRYTLALDGQIESMPDADLALLVSPHNPTGAVLNQASLRTAADSVSRRKGAVVFDEVFSSFLWEDIPFARPEGERSFTLNGASKLLCLPWLKLSWIVCGGQRRKDAVSKLETIADTFLPVNGFAQDALPDLFSALHEFHPALRAELSEKRSFAFDCLSGAGLLPALPDAGFSMVVTIPADLRPDLSEEDFVLALLREEHVCVHPGYFYDFDSDERRFVISFQNKKSLLSEAFGRITTFLSR
jgi:alanine-synthesizing transaminase